MAGLTEEQFNDVIAELQKRHKTCQELGQGQEDPVIFNRIMGKGSAYAHAIALLKGAQNNGLQSSVP